MPILATEGGKNEFHLVPAETHQAVCFGVFDLGLQKSSFQGQEKIQHKILIGWEIDCPIPSGEFAGKRMTIYKRYTLSLSNKANLRKDLEGWRGKAFTADELKGFDIERLIGVNCMLAVVHNQSGEKTFANVSGVSKLMKNLIPMKPENPSTTPEWVAKIQAQAVVEEPEVADEPAEIVGGDDDSTPF